MKPETKILYNKYQYFLFLLSNERNELFLRSQNDLDYEWFFDSYDWVVVLHRKIKPLYMNFKTRRLQMMNKFEHGKYMILLRPNFCYDIRKLIVSFIL